MNCAIRRYAKLLVLTGCALTSIGLAGCGGGQAPGGTAGLGQAPAGPGGTATAGLGGPVTGSLPGSTPSKDPAGPTTGAAATADPAQRAFATRYLERVNQYRTRLQVPAVTLDEQIFAACVKRTPALANGMDDHRGFDPSGGASGECLAGTTDPAQAADMYYSEGPGGPHYELMFSARITRVGAAVGGRASVAQSR